MTSVICTLQFWTIYKPLAYYSCKGLSGQGFRCWEQQAGRSLCVCSTGKAAYFLPKIARTQNSLVAASLFSIYESGQNLVSLQKADQAVLSHMASLNRISKKAVRTSFSYFCSSSYFSGHCHVYIDANFHLVRSLLLLLAPALQALLGAPELELRSRPLTRWCLTAATQCSKCTTWCDLV